MDKTAQDLAWSVLPKEFKEEVKKEYYHDDSNPFELALLENLFGLHNLTSDAEGEVMLSVPRKRVMEIYNHCNGGGVQAIEDIFGKLTYDMNNDAIITPLDKFKGLPHLNEKQKAITDYEGYAPTLYPYEGKWFVSWISSEGDSILDFQADSPEKAIKLAYNHFFGPKCLPDKTCNVASAKPKPAELKYHVGDWVRVVSIDKHGHIGQITDVEIDNDGIFYKITDADGWHFLEKNLEPYTEPEKNHIPNPAKIVDNILKDSFHEHNRLHVAAMAMQGMLSNTTRFSSYEISDLVRISLNCADALLAECESSAQPLCHAKKGGPK